MTARGRGDAPGGRGCFYRHNLYPGTLGAIARVPSDSDDQLAGQLRSFLTHADGNLRLAGKPSDSLKIARQPPRTYLREAGAERPSVSDQLAPWFSGWVAVQGPMRGLAGCSPELREGDCFLKKLISKSCNSDSDAPGEPSGPTRDPRGRPPRRPTCSDGRRTAPTKSPGGERG